MALQQHEHPHPHPHPHAQPHPHLRTSEAGHAVAGAGTSPRTGANPDAHSPNPKSRPRHNPNPNPNSPTPTRPGRANGGTASTFSPRHARLKAREDPPPPSFGSRSDSSPRAAATTTNKPTRTQPLQRKTLLQQQAQAQAQARGRQKLGVGRRAGLPDPSVRTEQGRDMRVQLRTKVQWAGLGLQTVRKKNTLFLHDLPQTPAINLLQNYLHLPPSLSR